MRRFVLSVLLLGTLSSLAPAHAAPLTITYPTLGNFRAARQYYLLQGEQSQGVIGYVFSLPASALGKPFTVKKLGGQTAIEDFDAIFYDDLQVGEPECLFLEPGNPKGRVCALNLLVTLYTGYEGEFTLTIG